MNQTTTDPCRLGRITLELALHRLGGGYGYDLVSAALLHGLSETDCDALFRTLILDDGVDVEYAETLLCAAHAHTPEIEVVA